MLRVIQEVQPIWIVGENVLGLVNWNGGLVFDEVQADLEAEGYEVQPYVLPAAGVGAPHIRSRVWFVAYSKCPRTRGDNGAIGNERRKASQDRSEGIRQAHGKISTSRIDATSEDGTSSDTSIQRLKEQRKQPIRGKEIEPKRGDSEKPTSDPEITGYKGISKEVDDSERGGKKYRQERGGVWNDARASNIVYASNTNDQGLQGGQVNGGARSVGTRQHEQLARFVRADWHNFPTVAPIRGKYDGFSDYMVRYIKGEIYATISERYTDKDLQEVWKKFQSEEIRQKIGGLYKIQQSSLLLEVLQLCSPSNSIEKGTSVFSQEVSEISMRKLQEYGTFANTPQGRELEKQFFSEFADTLPYLSHEIALVTMEVERRTISAISKHRNESIKAYGNAIVPQVAHQIFKAIQQYKDQLP
jgi:site-specific DNA-cytosine methylase